MLIKPHVEPVDAMETDTPKLVSLLLTASDLAAELRASVKTITRMHQAGRLPAAVKVGTGRVKRWSRETIIRWISAGAPNRKDWERENRNGSWSATRFLVHPMVEATPPHNLEYAGWPPLVSILTQVTEEAVQELDTDLELVLRHAPAKPEADTTQFLRARSGDSRFWYGGLFDMWVRATVLKQQIPVAFDCPLPNGRNHDMRFELAGRPFHFEHTVITEDDESREVWDRFIQDKRLDPTKVLTRPGPYCPPDAKGPSPYYNTLRVYAKVYDKIAPDLNPGRSQCADAGPNILLLSFAGAGVRPDDFGVCWALDELFAAQPKAGGRIANFPPHLTDISLGAWIGFTANQLLSSGNMSNDFYRDNFDKIIFAPRRLSGILLFKNCRLESARINYNADATHRISHAEIAQVEQMLSQPPSYAV